MKNKSSKNSTGCIVILIVLYLISSYIACIVNFLWCDFASPYKAEIIYGIGLFTGLGSLYGWFNFGK